MKNTTGMSHDQKMNQFGIRVYDAVVAWQVLEPGPLYTNEDLQENLVSCLKLDKNSLTLEDLLWLAPTVAHQEALRKDAYENEGRRIHDGY